MKQFPKLTVEDTRVGMEACRKKALEIGVPMDMAVTDESGNLIAFERMDGGLVGCIQIAIDKAYTASVLGVKTEEEGSEMLSTGFGNPTPWQCPRDVSEEELGKRIDDLASKVENMESCIFNIHVPPFDSRLDDAPKLDDTLQVKEGGMTKVPVGSRAVRQAIEKYQPLLSLHGHIHESKGRCKIGETVCINPGSNYQNGMLQAVIVEVEPNRVKTYTPITG